MVRTPNYGYVVDSTFDPFSFGELVQPLEIYKEAYKEAEDRYTDLVDKTNTFKYLSETLPEGSKARAIYEGYASELDKQAKDLSKHGLNMGNRRALTNLKNRYQGEIGRLMKADRALEEEKALRRQANLKDSSMLYADDNLGIDQFLDGHTPNLYSISGTELYTRGAAAGKAASSRVYQAGDAGSTLGGYYRKWVEKYGYGKESMDAFRANASAIPELQQAAEAIAIERGVYDNLTGINKERARQSILNGIIDGAVYQEKVNPVRDAGVMSASERDTSARGWASYNLQKDSLDFQRATSGYERDENGQWVYNPQKDITVQKAAALAGSKGGSHQSTTYDARNKATVMVGSKTGKRYKSQDDAKVLGQFLESTDNLRALTDAEYTQLTDGYGAIANEYLRSALGNGSLADYEIAIIPAGSVTSKGWFSDDKTDEDIYVVVPRESKRSNTTSTRTTGSGDGSEDIPQ